MVSNGDIVEKLYRGSNEVISLASVSEIELRFVMFCIISVFVFELY